MIEILVIIFLSIVLIWLAFLSFYTYKTLQKYNILIKGADKGDLADFVNKIVSRLEIDKTSIEELKKGLDEVNFKSQHHIQKVGVLRYNPFSDTGGDQSFVLAILDAKDSGVVISSLHTRGQTRWYAKNVKDGKGEDFELSKEENDAIKKASHIKIAK
jgi:hypothetical protein